MIIVLILMVLGIIAGTFINRFPTLIKVNDKLISIAIYLLLFLLGISVGLNKTILQNLGKIGFQALIITIGAVAGSVLCSWLLYKFIFKSAPNNTPNEK